MKYTPLKLSFLTCFLRSLFLVALAATLAAAPLRAAAEKAAAAAGSSTPVASSSAITPATAETPKSEEQQEQAFLHAPVVQSLARMLHLSLDTTMYLLLGINFAIIMLTIPYAFFRWLPSFWLPNALRKRREKLRDDLESAHKVTESAQARLSAVEAKLAGLGEEMQKFRAQVEQDSIEDEKRIKVALGEEGARIVAAAEQEIGVAAAQAKRGLRNFAADLAIEQASKQVVLTPETDRALISEFVAGVAADGSGKGGKN